MSRTRGHAFWRIFHILFPKFLCKFCLSDSFHIDRLRFCIRYLDCTMQQETMEEKKKRQGTGTGAFAWPFHIIHAKERVCG